MRRLFLIVVVAAAAALAPAQSAKGTLKLIVRSANGAFPAYRIPVTSSLSSATPALNDYGQIAIKALDDNSYIWLGNSDGGGFVAASNGDGLSDPWINNSGRVVWPDGLLTPLGIYSYFSGSTTPYVLGPSGATEWSSARINNLGQVAFRGGVFGVRQHLSYDPMLGTYAVHASQSGNISFLFTPSFNNARKIASKVLLVSGPGSDPNEIRLFNPDGSYTLVAQDDGANLLSPYASFNNSVGLNDDGFVAFNAALVSGGRGVYFTNGMKTIEIANSNTTAVGSNIEAFAPSVNNRGDVVFRAFDDNGKRAIWIGRGGHPLRVVTEGDWVRTDLGWAQIGWPSGFPAFSGSPALNQRGQVAFACGLINPAIPSQLYGIGVFLWTPPPGFENR